LFEYFYIEKSYPSV